MFFWSFEISGEKISLITPDSYLLELCQNYFRFYSIGSTPAASVSERSIRLGLRFSRTPTKLARLIPATAQLIAQQEITSIWKDTCRGREQYYFQFNFGNALFRVDPVRGCIVGVISPDALQWSHLMVNTYVFMTLMLALRWRSIYHLHTAAVISPHQQLGLICGTPRAGKTTLTTALGIAGWRPISDDGVLLQMNSQGCVEVQAFRRDFHLAAILLQQWSEIRSMEVKYFYRDRACVNGLGFFAAEAFASSAFTQVSFIVFPEITGKRDSYLEPLLPSNALQRLIEQSMFFPLERKHTQQQLQALTTFVKAAACYRLGAGLDIWTDPHCAAALLQELK